MNILHITPKIYDQMLHYLIGFYPLEACGLLAGSPGNAHHLYPIDNILHSPVAYEMDPKQQIEAMLDIEVRQWEMVAIFHSHPTGPDHPSPTDIAQAYYPDTAYVIVSLSNRANPIAKAYLINNGRYRQIPLNRTEKL